MSDYVMMLVLGVATLIGIALISHSAGANSFNPSWVLAAEGSIILVMVLYIAFWLCQIKTLLTRLISLLTGEEPPRSELRAVVRALWAVVNELHEE